VAVRGYLRGPWRETVEVTVGEDVARVHVRYEGRYRDCTRRVLERLAADWRFDERSNARPTEVWDGMRVRWSSTPLVTTDAEREIIEPAAYYHADEHRIHLGPEAGCGTLRYEAGHPLMHGEASLGTPDVAPPSAADHEADWLDWRRRGDLL
jgi:hypothetical protein